MSPDDDAGGHRRAMDQLRKIPRYALTLGALVVLAILSWHRPDWLGSEPGRSALSAIIAAALVGAALAFRGAGFLPTWGRVLLILLAAYGVVTHTASLLRITSPDLPPWLQGEVLAAVLVLPLAVLVQGVKIGIGWRQGSIAPSEVRRGVGFLLSVAIAVPSLSAARGPSSGEPLGERRRFGLATFTNAEVVYGLAPRSDARVVYQPDVVVVGGGAESVRSVSADGAVWTIKGGAPGIRRVRPGAVMFLTSRGVGRVLAVTQVDGDVTVVLGPVDLTDVIREGIIEVSQPVDLQSAAFVQTPGAATDIPSLVGNLLEHEPQARYADVRLGPTLELPPVRLVGFGRPGGAQGSAAAMPGPTYTTSGQLGIGPFVVEAAKAGEAITLRIAYARNANWNLSRPPRAGGGDYRTGPEATGWARGLEFGIVLTLHTADPTVQSRTEIRDGKVVSSEFKLDGIRQIDVEIQAGSKGGLADNVQQRIEIPIDLVIPVMPAAGVPLNFALRQKFQVQTAFTAKNSTLVGRGSYSLSGALAGSTGGGSGTAVTPTFVPRQSLLSSLTGASIGVNGIVVTWHVRAVLGVGLPAFFVGPHAGITFSFGATRGSDIGLLVCRMLSVDVAVNNGIGFKAELSSLDAFKRLLEPLGLGTPEGLKLDSDFYDYSKPVYHRVDVEPGIRLCTG
jgi:hypothetical protein